MMLQDLANTIELDLMQSPMLIVLVNVKLDGVEILRLLLELSDRLPMLVYNLVCAFEIASKLHDLVALYSLAFLDFFQPVLCSLTALFN